MANLLDLFIHSSKFFSERIKKNIHHAFKYLIGVIVFLSLENIFMIYFPLLVMPNSILAKLYSIYQTSSTPKILIDVFTIVINGIPRIFILLAFIFLVGFLGARFYKIKITNNDLLKISCYSIVPSIFYYLLNDIYILMFELISGLGMYAKEHSFIFQFFQFFGIFYCFYLLIEGIKLYKK